MYILRLCNTLHCFEFDRRVIITIIKSRYKMTESTLLRGEWRNFQLVERYLTSKQIIMFVTFVQNGIQNSYIVEGGGHKLVSGI